MEEPDRVDVAIVGAGAAGLMTAITAAREARALPAARAPRIALLDGELRPGKKILVSGGGRCNVTNRTVTPADFHGDRRAVARVLARFGADDAVRFFDGLGVPLKHEPEFDKLFPVSDDARTVLDALLAECARLGCPVRGGFRVRSAVAEEGGFVVASDAGAVRARRLVLATGGRSMPSTGSDGGGYGIARALGHTVGTTVPALVPLVLHPHPFPHLAGISFPAEIVVRAASSGEGRVAARVRGPLLVTHFGISGPAALDVSRHWSTAAAAGAPPSLRLSVFPGEEPADVERAWLDAARSGGARTVGSLLARLPHRIAQRIAGLADVAPDRRIAELTRESRGRLLAAATALPLPVKDTRGFNAAEVTAGGVPLDEVDVRTMESRRRPGLHLVGEILDVDGRLGGFNFQWAWATGFVCGQAVGRLSP